MKKNSLGTNCRNRNDATGVYLALAAATRYSLTPHSGYPTIDNIGCTAAAFIRPYVDSSNRTVGGAGSAFHAAVMVDDRGLFAMHSKDAMRTDGRAISAADARIVVKLEYGGVVKVSEIFHNRYLTNKWRCKP